MNSNRTLVAVVIILGMISAFLAGAFLIPRLQERAKADTKKDETPAKASPSTPASVSPPVVQSPAPSPVSPVAQQPRLTCADIVQLRKGATQLQWTEQARSLEGREAEFGGNVLQVYDDGQVLVSSCPGFLTTMRLAGISRERAAQLTKGTNVRGWGKISKITGYLAVSVEVKIEKLE